MWDFFTWDIERFVHVGYLNICTHGVFKISSCGIFKDYYLKIF